MQEKTPCQIGYHRSQKSFVEEPHATESVDTGSTQDADPEVPPFVQRPKVLSQRNLFSHIHKEPNCDALQDDQDCACQMSKKRPEIRSDGVALPTQFGEV